MPANLSVKGSNPGNGFFIVRAVDKVEFTNINLTITSMSYKGKRQSSCVYAGLAAFTTTNKTYHEDISTICKTNADDTVFSSLFSTSDKMLIIVYFYPRYAEHNVSFEMSGTKCVPLKVNMCYLPFNESLFLTEIILPVLENPCVVLQLRYGIENTDLFTFQPKFIESPSYGNIETHALKSSFDLGNTGMYLKGKQEA